jgi:hypothetical protein
MSHLYKLYWHYEGDWVKTMAYAWNKDAPWPRKFRFYSMLMIWKFKFTFTILR